MTTSHFSQKTTTFLKFCATLFHGFKSIAFALYPFLNKISGLQHHFDQPLHKTLHSKWQAFAGYL
jgi:hypothetical protein